jgi:hypothetical protein
MTSIRARRHQRSTAEGPAVRLRELDRRRAREALVVSSIRTTAIVVALLVVYAVLPNPSGSTLDVIVRTAVGGVAIIAVVAWQVQAISKARFPQLRAAEALAISVTFMLIVFAGTYLSMSKHNPAAFTESLSETSALYFTATTLSTIGYGDIAAKTDGARIIVMVQMVFNVAVIGAGVRLLFTVAKERLATSDRA